jgi:hypothetical protein
MSEEEPKPPEDGITAWVPCSPGGFFPMENFVSDEMVKAGAAALLASVPQDDLALSMAIPEDVVRAIYAAMRAVAQT